MAITKDGKKWKLDFRPEGSNGRRLIRLFDTKGEALQFERMTLRQVRSIEACPIDNRTLSDLIPIWYDLHGRGLKSSKDMKNRLLRLSDNLNNPVAKTLKPEQFAIYRNSRLDANIAPSTMNRELSYLKALYSELKRLSVIDYESTILKVVKKLKESRTELSYLTTEQINQLMIHVDASKNESLPFVVKICLVTGARWSEAEGLTYTNCINQGFQFVDTKNGKNRFVPVDNLVFLQVKERLQQSPFKPCYWAYRVAFTRSALIVSIGQLAHVLRHTFASHFIMNGGNVLTLQRILGHSSLNVTMRYSHLSSDYLHQAIKFNPLAIKDVGKKMESVE